MEICIKIIKKLKVIMEILRRTLRVPQRTGFNLVQDSSIGIQVFLLDLFYFGLW